jgi:4-amino-4-deoxy-L-arabinose transferase-like glycosyltransferase
MSEATRASRDLWLAIALAALFAFTGLTGHPLEAADEPRVAGIAWEMQHTGQWLVPHLGGEPFLEHPPLFYAVLGAFVRAFGASEGVARLPGALASFATALIVFALARRVADRSAGIPALLALVGIAGFARYSHRVVVDPLLMLFVTAGYAAYVRALWERAQVRHRWLLAVYGAAALAFWVKGPIGVVALGGPIAIDVLAARRWRALASPAHLLGVPLLAAACLAWPLVLQQVEGPAAARAFLVDNGWYRIAPGTSGGDYLGGHQHPFWYYLPELFGQLGYSTLVVPAVAVWLWRGHTPEGWRLPALRFLGAVFPLGVLLLSFAGTKRSLYLLPFEPVLAVAIGAWIAAAARGDPGRSRVEAFLCALCARVLAWLRPLAARFGRAGARLASDLAADVARAAAGASRAPYRAAVLVFAATVGWNVVGLPFTGDDRDLGPMARDVAARVGDAPLVMFRPREALLGALPFYAARIPPIAYELSAVARLVDETRAHFVVAPLAARDELARVLGNRATLAASWTVVREEYGLFAVEPASLAADLTHP